MIALWIVLGILALCAAILCIDVAVVFVWDGDWKLRLRFWGIPINLKKIIQKERKTEKKPKKKKEKDEETPEKPKEKRTFEEFCSFVSAIVRAVKSAASSLRKHLHIRLNVLKITVSGSDAAEIAKTYGTVNAVVYGARGALSELCDFRVREKRLIITPDFDGGKWNFRAKLTFRIKPVFILTAGFSAWRAFTRDLIP